MRHAPSPLPHRTTSRLALLVVLVCAGLMTTAGPARAAGRLTSAQPADGAALAAAPAELVLTFSRPPDPSRSHITVRDTAGHDVDTSAPAGRGTDGLRLAMSIRTPGDYAVTYHVVLDDGSNVVGVLRFSSGTGIPPAGAPPGAGAEAGHTHGVDPLGATLLVADLVVLVVVGGLLLRRRPG